MTVARIRLVRSSRGRVGSSLRPLGHRIRGLVMAPLGLVALAAPLAVASQ